MYTYVCDLHSRFDRHDEKRKIRRRRIEKGSEDNEKGKRKRDIQE
jgi:hypothetical protein